MNIKHLFGVVAMAALGLTACTNDEPIGGGENAAAQGDKFVSVRIHNVGTPGSRAAGEGFEEGISNENTIEPSDCRFYFFDNNGNPFALSAAGVDGELTSTNMVKPTTLTTNIIDGNECTYEGLLIISVSSDNVASEPTPSRMVCIANLSDPTIYAKLAGISIDDMRKEISQIDGGVNTDKFAMSSSTYIQDGVEICWSDLTGKMKDTQEDAIKEPAHIYVERLVAKVRVNGLGSYMSQQLKEDGKTYEDAYYSFYNPATGQITKKRLKVTLDGWRMRNTFKQVKYLKSLNGTMPNFVYNASDYHRSYWAITGNETNKLQERFFNIYDNKQFTLGNYPATGSEDEKKAASAYIYPSTSWWNQPNFVNSINEDFIASTGTDAYAKPISNRVSNATAVVVKAHVNFVDENGNIDATADNNIVNWHGTYYTLADFKEFVINSYKGENPSSTFTADDVTINNTDENGHTSSHDNMRSIKVNGEIYSTLGKVKFWQNGLCSFYVNVQHDKEIPVGDKEGNPIFGIVRNHIYDITMSAVVGLGVPGNDIDNPKEPTESFLAAHIDVLNWKVVKNTIVLE